MLSRVYWLRCKASWCVPVTIVNLPRNPIRLEICAAPASLGRLDYAQQTYTG